MLEPSVVDRIPTGHRVSIERDTFPALVAEEKVFAMASGGYWLDAGTPATYLRANLDAIRRATPPAPGARRGDSGVWTVGRPVIDGDLIAPALVGDAAFVAGDWGGALVGGFDAVVANPPYIATGGILGLMPEVRDHDPRLALDGGADGLAAYRAIVADLSRLLVPGGLFAGEIGMGQEAAVAAIVAAGGLMVETIAPDLAGIPRCLVASLPF